MGAVELHEIELVDAPAQIPPGEYSAYYTKHETAFMYRSAKVFVHFRIQGGEYHGMHVYRAFRVKELRGKPRKGGAFKLRHSQELYRQFVRLTASGRERPDRISLHRLRGCLLRISVRTVTKDSRQRELPENLQYSVVDELLSMEVGQL
tara:strand:+ start:139 stop:585 length:447 start_codon:yes stop_codon:yes gene_type:complete